MYYTKLHSVFFYLPILYEVEFKNSLVNKLVLIFRPFAPGLITFTILKNKNTYIIIKKIVDFCRQGKYTTIQQYELLFIINYADC